MLRVRPLTASRLLGAVLSLSLLVVASSPAYARLRPQGPPSAGTTSALYTVRSPGGAVSQVRFALADAHVVTFTISRAGQPDHVFTGDLEQPVMTLRVGQKEVARVVGGNDTTDAQLVTAAGAFTVRQLKDVPSLYTGGALAAARDAFVADFDVLWALVRINPHVGYFQTPYAVAAGDWNYDRLAAKQSSGDTAEALSMWGGGVTPGGCTNNCKFWFTACTYDANNCVRGCEVQWGMPDNDYWRSCPLAGGSNGNK